MTEIQRKSECDDRLVGRSLNGDQEAFGCLFDRYARLIRASVYDATRNLSLSQDVTQESFLRAWRDLSALRDPACFLTWLVGISKQVCREHCRANRRFPQGDVDTLFEMLSVNNEGHTDLTVRERDQYVMDVVGQLPEKERLAIHLFYLKQQDAQQVAEILELSRSGMYALLKRALKELAQKLKSIAPEKESQS